MTELHRLDALDTEEPELVAKARRAGRLYGDSFPSIWEPERQIASEVYAAAAAHAAAMQVPPRLVRSPWYWLGWLLFLSGLVIFLLAMRAEYYAEFINPWFINTVAWGIVVWLAFSGYWKAAKIHDARRSELSRVYFEAATARIDARKHEARNYSPAESDRGGSFVPRGPAPLPQPFGVSHEGAEHLVAEWMRFLGGVEVNVTQFSGDGGIDISGLHYVAQVKNYTGAVDVAAVRELAGVAYADGRKPLFFTSGTYSSGAISFAEQVGIALFVYDAVAGTLSPVGELAKDVMTSGL